MTTEADVATLQGLLASARNEEAGLEVSRVDNSNPNMIAAFHNFILLKQLFSAVLSCNSGIYADNVPSLVSSSPLPPRPLLFPFLLLLACF